MSGLKEASTIIRHLVSLGHATVIHGDLDSQNKGIAVRIQIPVAADIWGYALLATAAKGWRKVPGAYSSASVICILCGFGPQANGDSLTIKHLGLRNGHLFCCKPNKTHLVIVYLYETGKCISPPTLT